PHDSTICRVRGPSLRLDDLSSARQRVLGRCLAAEGVLDRDEKRLRPQRRPRLRQRAAPREPSAKALRQTGRDAYARPRFQLRAARKKVVEQLELARAEIRSRDPPALGGEDNPFVAETLEATSSPAALADDDRARGEI